jgi:hypothetical protein
MPRITCVCPVATEAKLTRGSTTTSALFRVRVSVAIIAAILFLTPALAFGDMCPTDYLPNVVALGSCTIGNLTLDLSGYSAQGNPTAGWAGGGEPTFLPQFVPTAAPNPGFELLFPELADCSTCDNNFSYSSTINDGPSTGSTVAVLLNPFYSSDPTLQALGLLANLAFPEWAQEPNVEGSMSFELNSYSFSASQLYGQPMNVTQTGSNPIVNAPTSSASGELSSDGQVQGGLAAVPTVSTFAPTPSASGELSSDGQVQGGLVATVEPQPNGEVPLTAVVPEPQSVFLLGTVSFLLIPPLRRLPQKRHAKRYF